MSDENQTVQAARQMMERTNPKCPNPSCASQGEWKYSEPDILHSYDMKEEVDYIKPLVQISCAKCGQEMAPYIGQN